MRRPKGSYLKLTPDPTAGFSLNFSHPQRSPIFSGGVALEQCTFLGFEPQTRVFGYTPEAAKGRTRSSVHTIGAENISFLAAVSITLILCVEGWTCEVLSSSGVLRGARRTLRAAHPITSSLSDAAWAYTVPSLPALHSTEAAFCRLRAPRSFYSDSSWTSASSAARRFARSDFSSSCVAALVLAGFFFSSIAPGCVAEWIFFNCRMDTWV